MNRTGYLLTAFIMIVATTAREVAKNEVLSKHFAPDVHVLCRSHHFGWATVGWVTLRDESILIDCPHPTICPKILARIEIQTGKPLKRVVLDAHSRRKSQLEAAQKLLERGIGIYAEHQTALLLKQALLSDDPAAQAVQRSR